MKTIKLMGLQYVCALALLCLNAVIHFRKVPSVGLRSC